MNIKWYGTASVSIESQHNKILFDPFIPLPGSGIKVNKKDYEGFSHIFLTHGHVDHLASIPGIIRGTDTNIWCTKTPAKTLMKKGVNRKRIMLDHFDNSFPPISKKISLIELRKSMNIVKRSNVSLQRL